MCIQDGVTNFSHPIGTGPFVFSSFTPGQRSLCTKNPNYWETGKPYVDTWNDISITDNGARFNALLAGELDMMDSLLPTYAKEYLHSKQVQVVRAAPGLQIQVFLMAVNDAPFNDPLVREAFRFIPNRQQLIDDVFLGFGTVGNDVAGRNLWNFDSSLPPREQDLDRAKSLLKKAGKEHLHVTLDTADVIPGFVSAATLFAEQATGAGVTVNVNQVSASAYFNTSQLYTHIPFGQSAWTVYILSQWYDQALRTTSIWNETHWRYPSFDKLLNEAESAPNVTVAKRLWDDVAKVQYDSGGYILWVNADILDAAAPDVRGIVPAVWFNLGGYDYRDVWFA